jgi:hypothetical protein
VSLRCNRGRLARAEVADDPAFDLTSWTIEAVVRVERAPTSGQRYGLVGKGEAAPGTCTFRLEYAFDVGVAGAFTLGAGITTGGGVSNSQGYFPYELIPGRWYSVAASWDNTPRALAIYAAARQGPGRDAAVEAYVSVGSAVLAFGGPDANATVLRVGSGSDTSGGPSHGADASIGEVRLWNSALAKATLDTRLAYRLAGDEAGLVGYWRADEGTGSTLYDRTRGAGRDAPLKERPDWSDAPPDLWYPGGLVAAGEGLIGLYSATLGPLATVTASEAQAAYPASNLRVWRQARVWRSLDANGQKTVTVDMGRPLPIVVASAYNHNLSSKALVNLQLHSADSWGAPDVDEEVTYHPARLLHLLARPYWYRYARLVVTDAAAAGGYIQLGTLDLWVAWDELESAGIEAHAMEDRTVVVSTPHGAQAGRRVLPEREALSLSAPHVRRGPAWWLRPHLDGHAVLLCPDVRRGLYPWTRYGPLVRLPSESLGDPVGLTVAWDELSVESDRP